MAKVNSNQKGKRGERGAVGWLKELGFHDARRTQQRRGDLASDIECPETLPNLHIEVKFWRHRNHKSLHAAIFQAENDCPPGKRAVVIWRCTHWKDASEWSISYLGGKRGSVKGPRTQIRHVPPDKTVCVLKLKELNYYGTQRPSAIGSTPSLPDTV
jgi:hypothetical protein